MSIFNVSNQLLQIDTGKARTFLYNPSLSPIKPYAGIGENQVLGQRYFGVNPGPLTNGFTSPAVYMLVQYKADSVTVDGNLPAAPAPVFWSDNTFSTISGIPAESTAVMNGIAGYMLANTTDIPGLTAAQLKGAQLLIQVAGFLPGGVVPAATVAGDWIYGSASGPFTPARLSPGTAPGSRYFGVATSAYAAGLADLLLNCDII